MFSEIKNIQFGFLTNSEIEKISVCEINNSKLTGKNSVYDERLGTSKNHEKCITCGKKILECTGHFGHIKLQVPIVHPMFRDYVLNCLECFCEKCSHLLITKQHIKLIGYDKYNDTNRFEYIHSYIKTKINECPKCREIQCKYQLIDGKVYKMSDRKDSKEDKAQMSSVEIKSIFEKITDCDLKIVGLTKYSPLDLIIQNLPVLPICCRSFVVTNKGIHDDDLTTKYVEVIKINNKLKKENGEKTRQDLIRSLEFHIETFMDNSSKKSRQINGRPIKCIRKRLDEKSGLFRSHLLGKRTDFSGRTVIGPDSYIKADEVVVPDETATTITFPERVFDLNIDELQKLVDEQKANYVIRDGQKTNLGVFFQPKLSYRCPVSGICDIVMRNGKKIDVVKFQNIRHEDLSILPSDVLFKDGKVVKYQEKKYIPCLHDKVLRNGKFINPWLLEYAFKYQQGDKIFRDKTELDIEIKQKTNFEIKIGDVVERHLRSGDIVYYNRQPSLHTGSMIAKRVRVLKQDPRTNSGHPAKTFRMNSSNDFTFNSDFDGQHNV
jgi:DNA-directed RNA polymerase beta' subunit